MRKLLSVLLLAVPLAAQVSAPNPQSRVAGRFVAYNYGKWSTKVFSVPSGTGSRTFTVVAASFTLTDGRQIMPYSTTAPLRVGNETVTPSKIGAGCIITNASNTCQITATFSQAHVVGETVSSATFGLQEALNDAGASGGGAVTIDSAWAGLGGTTTIKNAATLPSSTGIEDVRTGTGGGGSSLPTATAKGQVATASGAGTTYTAVSPGVFNVRTMFGGVPDGSADNATAIAAAFTASNAVSTGIPTVYFDCDTTAGQCTYSYGGAGISPINPTHATSIVCAPGVTLKYTGTAHAVDLGPNNLTGASEQPYTVEGCRFTGGASYTQGIYVNTYLTWTKFMNNTFYNFGNTTGWNIYYVNNNWESLVFGNHFYDDDAQPKNTIQGETANAVQYIGNNVECGSSTTPCPVDVGGSGFVLSGDSRVIGNVIQYHFPLLRFSNTSSANGLAATVIGNHFETNTGQHTPVFTYGDPGAVLSGDVYIGCNIFSDNILYTNPAAGIPIVGPETPASGGTYLLSHCKFDNNNFSGSITQPYVVTNFGSLNEWGRNYAAGNPLTPVANQIFDFPSRNYYDLPLSGQYTAGRIQMTDTAAAASVLANFHAISAQVGCISSTGAGNTKGCFTNPTDDGVGGPVYQLAANDCMLVTSNGSNTGATTMQVNGAGPLYPIKKQSGSSLVDLASGDIITGVKYLMCLDSSLTNLIMHF